MVDLLVAKSITQKISSESTVDALKTIFEPSISLQLFSDVIKQSAKELSEIDVSNQAHRVHIAGNALFSAEKNAEVALTMYKNIEILLENAYISVVSANETLQTAHTTFLQICNSVEDIYVQKKTVDIAFYTVFITSDFNKFILYHRRVPNFTPPSKVHDCYFYTNSVHIYESLKNTKWIPILLKYTVDTTKSNDHFCQDTMFAKHLKAMPHLYEELNKYEYTFYFDATVKKINVEKVEELATHSLRFKINPDIKNGILNELHEAILQPRYAAEKERYELYIKEQILKGFAMKTDVHLVSTFILRKMNDPAVIQFNTVWYENIIKCGIECQIALFFVNQMFPGLIKEFHENPSVN